MPAKKKQSWLEKNWPFRHTETRLNADTNLIKLVAMITMLIDHLGAAVFPQYRILRVIGRVAFPIYAYCIAVGCAYTRNIGRYLERLAILALISQPIYVLALHHTNSLMYACSFAQAPLRAAFSFYVYSWKDPSILLTLMVGVGAIWVLRERKLLHPSAGASADVSFEGFAGLRPEGRFPDAAVLYVPECLVCPCPWWRRICSGGGCRGARIMPSACPLASRFSRCWPCR